MPPTKVFPKPTPLKDVVGVAPELLLSSQKTEMQAEFVESNVRLGNLIQQNYNFLSGVLTGKTKPTQEQLEASRIVGALK